MKRGRVERERGRWGGGRDRIGREREGEPDCASQSTFPILTLLLFFA